MGEIVPEEELLLELEQLVNNSHFDDLRSYNDAVLERPWLNGDKYRLDFDPKMATALFWYRAKQNGGGRAGLSFLIGLGVEMGNDLEKVARFLKQDRRIEFQRLCREYGLVSYRWNIDPSWSFTLSHLCSCFPTITCEYLHNRPTPQCMTDISPDYPAAMMTSAFAFLVPNRSDAYCTLLMKAHMLHIYEAKMCYGNCGVSDSDIPLVVKQTLAAITASCVKYDQQIGFLKRIGLVQVNVVGGQSQSKDAAAEEFVVSEGVAAAARVWDSRDSNNLTKHFTLFYH